MADFYEGSDLKLMIKVQGTGFNQASDPYTIDLYNDSDKLSFTSWDDVKPDGEGGYYLPVSHTQLHAGSLTMIVTAQVPDLNFAGGYRQEVARPISLPPIKKVPK